MTASETERIELPPGFAVGHWTDREGWTGCTVVLGPPETISAGEVRGGGPATREFELLSPASSTPGAHAFVLAGGSAFGLAAADGVVGWLAERGIGLPTPAGPVPLVSSGACFDLTMGSAKARPGPESGRAACEAAGPVVERGNVGAGAGCTAGKAMGEAGRTKTGLGAATMSAGEATIVAIAVANPFGEVIGADGEILAGCRVQGGWRPTVDVLRASPVPMRLGENTTLACLITDAKLSKLDAWKAARAASAGFARAIRPVATAVDGDLVACLSAGEAEVDRLLFEAVAAEVTAEAIRDSARSAEDVPGVPSLHGRA